MDEGGGEGCVEAEVEDVDVTTPSSDDPSAPSDPIDTSIRIRSSYVSCYHHHISSHSP